MFRFRRFRYTGGELLRLLLFHPNVEVKQVTSESYTENLFTRFIPTCVSQPALKFVSANELEARDLYSCVRHTTVRKTKLMNTKISSKIIDLSADFV